MELFYVDTEFADSYLAEIGMINAAGDEVINTLIDLMLRLDLRLEWRKLRRTPGEKTV